jgi:hypothetical protein
MNTTTQCHGGGVMTPIDKTELGPAGDPLDTPVDLAAVQADDELLDLLAAGGFDDLLARADALYDPDAVAFAEMRVVLARVLAEWRRDVESEVIGAGRSRYPVLASFVVAAAVLVIGFAALGLASQLAGPGDLLWPLRDLLFGGGR